MARLEKQKHGSLFHKPSSSFARLTVHVTCLLMLLPSMRFSQATEGTKFCFDTREGHRLNATVHKKLHAWHEVDCVLRCLNDTCCRSANYLKTLDFGKEEDDSKDNCELLHDAVVSGRNDILLQNDDYDYFIMENPGRSFNCNCVKCENNKTCNATSKKCECPTGFTGSQCGDDIDECISNPCDTNANCENVIGSYTCKCKKGFTADGTICTDIDECLSSPCHTNATCNNTIGSFICKCEKGFNGDGTNCQDIDECISNPCDTNATCKNNNDSFTCTCNYGFTGNGTTCTDINECSSDPCGDRKDCEDGIGSYTCKCERGYLNNGNTCQGDKRLNAFVYKKNITQSIEECKNLCVDDDCCRSINYRKIAPSGEEKICELLLVVDVDSNSWELENKPGFKHQKLLYPDRQTIATACYGWCKNDGKCGVPSKKCSCPDPGTQENPQCNEGSLNSSVILEGNCTYLSKLYEWLGNKTKWCLCYGAVEDQWNVEDFHPKCDNYQHTVTIVRYGRNNIVGGYSDVTWGDEY